jgi:hypothetical protein
MDARLQLRINRIEPGRMAEFLAAWRAGVVPLRRRFGFEIEGAWVAAAEDRFCWLLRYDGEGTFAEADRTYYGSTERKELADDPARFIVDSELMMVEPIHLGATGEGVAGAEPPAGPFDPPP